MEDFRMIYIESQVKGETKKYLEEKLEKDVLNQFTIAKKTLNILKQFYCNLNQKINLQNQFQTLRQNDKDFHTF